MKTKVLRMFCPSCKALLRPLDNSLRCPRCEYVQEIDRKGKPAPAKKNLEADLADVPVFSDLDTMPIDENRMCHKCQNRGAYWHLRQTRAADEATTRFYRCTKCKHSWREYA